MRENALKEGRVIERQKYRSDEDNPIYSVLNGNFLEYPKVRLSLPLDHNGKTQTLTPHDEYETFGPFFKFSHSIILNFLPKV